MSCVHSLTFLPQRLYLCSIFWELQLQEVPDLNREIIPHTPSLGKQLVKIGKKKKKGNCWKGSAFWCLLCASAEKAYSVDWEENGIVVLSCWEMCLVMCKKPCNKTKISEAYQRHVKVVKTQSGLNHHYSKLCLSGRGSAFKLAASP